MEDPLKDFDYESVKLTKRLLISCCLASLGSFSFGYNLSMVNTPKGTFENCSSLDSTWACLHVAGKRWDFFVAILCVGALIGCLSIGKLANSYGRKKCLIWLNLFYFVGLSLMTFSYNYLSLILGRIISGIGVGCACIVVPLYITEISPLKYRGLLGSLHQMAIVIGFLFGETFGYFGLYKPYYWRLMFGFDLIPTAIQTVGVSLICSESPLYLIMRNEPTLAKIELAKNRSKDHDQSELDSLLNIFKDCQKSNDTWGLYELLITNRKQSFRSVLTASSLHLGQQLSGINSILFFSSSIFTKKEVPLLIAILNLIMTVLSILAIDKVGRRYLAISSSGIMTLSAILLTIGFVYNYDWVSTASVLLFVGSFAFGMGPVPWLMTNELFPTHAAGSAVSIAVSLNWIANLAVTFSFGSLLNHLKAYAFIPYTVVLGLFFLFACFFLPETKGRPASFV